MSFQKRLKKIIGQERYDFLREHIYINALKIKQVLNGQNIYFRPVKGFPLEPYGEERYGGYYIYDKLLNEKSIVYSCGIGEDISFDQALIKKIGCKVFAFDPDKRAQRFVKAHGLEEDESFLYFPYAISAIGGGYSFSWRKQNRFERWIRFFSI